MSYQREKLNLPENGKFTLRYLIFNRIFLHVKRPIFFIMASSETPLRNASLLGLQFCFCHRF